jgi:hypothetical protein
MQQPLNISRTDLDIDDVYGIEDPPPQIKQLRCWVVAQAIDEYCRSHGGQSPTIKELAIMLNKQIRTINIQVEQLRYYGLAVRRNRKLYLVGAKYTSPDWLK